MRLCSILLIMMALAHSPHWLGKSAPRIRPDRRLLRRRAKRLSAEATRLAFRIGLLGESSPYLLQHAHNPVDWYPWGEDAFAKAKREDKMIFLSVGYAACHWCHVMERESFTDPEIAAKLNDQFVCIKVDREERPDVDQIYMTAVQLMSGQGRLADVSLSAS